VLPARFRPASGSDWNGGAIRAGPHSAWLVCVHEGLQRGLCPANGSCPLLETEAGNSTVKTYRTPWGVAEAGPGNTPNAPVAAPWRRSRLPDRTTAVQEAMDPLLETHPGGLGGGRSRAREHTQRPCCSAMAEIPPPRDPRCSKPRKKIRRSRSSDVSYQPRDGMWHTALVVSKPKKKITRMQHSTSKGPGPANHPNTVSNQVPSPALGPLRI
jgi:hypothetical protein